MNDTPAAGAAPIHPPGEYAIVELFGHTTLVGRITEIERFGAKMMAIEPLFRDQLLPTVLHGGAAIYRLTPCTAEVAFARQPKQEWQIPAAIRCIVPAALIDAPPPEPQYTEQFSVVDLQEDEEAGADE